MCEPDFALLEGKMIPFAREAIIADGFVIPLGASVSTDGEVIPLQRIQPPDDDDAGDALGGDTTGTILSVAGGAALAMLLDVTLLTSDERRPARAAAAR